MQKSFLARKTGFFLLFKNEFGGVELHFVEHKQQICQCFRGKFRCAREYPQFVSAIRCDQGHLIIFIQINDPVFAVKRPEKRYFKFSGAGGSCISDITVDFLGFAVFYTGIYHVQFAVGRQKIVCCHHTHIFFKVKRQPGDLVPFAEIAVDIKAGNRRNVGCCTAIGASVEKNTRENCQEKEKLFHLSASL